MFSSRVMGSPFCFIGEADDRRLSSFNAERGLLRR
jgi:hypothetical protein